MSDEELRELARACEVSPDDRGLRERLRVARRRRGLCEWCEVEVQSVGLCSSCINLLAKEAARRVITFEHWRYGF